MRKLHKFVSLLLALALLAALAIPAYAAGGFTDVPESHWAYDFIQEAAGLGIVNGVGGGRFSPAGTVTSAAFIAMLTRTFCPAEVEAWAAAGDSPWYLPNLRAAEDLGLLDGTDVQDHMEEGISRYDMAQIMARLMAVRGFSVPEADMEAARRGISDWNSVPDNRQDAVASCYALGLLTGVDSQGTFAGLRTMDRAQACAVVIRIMKCLDGEPAETDALQEIREAVLQLVNEAREAEGLPALTLDAKLCEAAQLRANEITGQFSHTRPDGSSCFTALKEAGISYRAAGENIAAGQRTPEAVMESWMNSPGHRDNILSANYTSIGIGFVEDNSGYGIYWVQMFTG